MAQIPRKSNPVVIPRRIDYFEVGVFSICALYGIIALSSYSTLAATAIRMYPGWGGRLFLALLIAGGATGLISYAFKTIMGPRLELAGLTLLVLLCIAYSLWTPFSVGLRGIGLLLFMGVLIAIPGFFTCRRIGRDIGELEAIEEQGMTVDREGGSSAIIHAVGGRRTRRGRRR